MRICNLDTVVDIEMRIPTVEGNIRSAAVINARTEADVIRVESTESGDDALYILRKHQFNFVLLDHRLSDKEGATLISRIRLAQHDISIIAFSISPQARFKAPSAGADDLIDPDIDRDELIARVRAFLRLSRGVSQSLLLVGNLTRDQHNVTANGMHVLLTAKEFAILELLVLRRNAMMTKKLSAASYMAARTSPRRRSLIRLSARSAKSLPKPDCFTSSALARNADISSRYSSRTPHVQPQPVRRKLCFGLNRPEAIELSDSTR